MIYLIADTHGEDISYYFEKEDVLIHMGDYEYGSLPNCHLILVRGNHDEKVKEGIFDIIVDGIMLQGLWLSHEPVDYLPKGSHINVHGHLHGNKYEDYGYRQKDFHFLMEPNRLYTLEEIHG